MPARDMCAYGRALLDVLFTKEEQAKSTVLRSKKSDKPPLAPERVQILFGKNSLKLNVFHHPTPPCRLHKQAISKLQSQKLDANSGAEVARR